MASLPASLASLTGAARLLTQALQSYQLAITDARKAGATWEQLSSAAGVPTATARSRHKTALHGGEMHLHLDSLAELEVLLKEEDER